MTSVAKRSATYADVLALKDNVIGEIVFGELLVSPRPSGPHAVAASAVGIEIGGPFNKGHSGGPGDWWILFEPELHLGGHVLVPDVAGWPRSVMATPPVDHRFTVPPIWLCEVLSPSNGQFDRIRKLDAYGQVGVQFVWIVDPQLKTLEVFQNQQGAWLRLQAFSHTEGDERIRAKPFDALELNLAGFWVP